MLILKLPYSVPIPTKKEPNKKFALNLNAYRNAHFHVLNKVKILFKELVKTQVEDIPKLEGKISLTYTVFPKTRVKLDVSNICSIADKFFSDALVELGKLDDDNFEHIPTIRYVYGKVDKENPRIEVLIESNGFIYANQNEKE